jgi:hypothetical protein
LAAIGCGAGKDAETGVSSDSRGWLDDREEGMGDSLWLEAWRVNVTGRP